MAKARRAGLGAPLRDSLGRRNGWITRRAIAAGKDPERVFAALRGQETKARKAEQQAREHGLRARLKSEQRLSPAEKAKRTRDANRIERPKGIQRGSGSAGGGGGFDDDDDDYGGGGFHAEQPTDLDDVLDDYGYDFEDYGEYDVETSPDYEEP